MCEVTSTSTAIAVAFVLLEYWLGKTNLIEAGSTLEVILNFLKKIVGIFFPAQK